MLLSSCRQISSKQHLAQQLGTASGREVQLQVPCPLWYAESL